MIMMRGQFSPFPNGGPDGVLPHDVASVYNREFVLRGSLKNGKFVVQNDWTCIGFCPIQVNYPEVYVAPDCVDDNHGIIEAFGAAGMPVSGCYDQAVLNMCNDPTHGVAITEACQCACGGGKDDESSSDSSDSEED